MIIMIVIRFSYDKGITMIKYRIFLNVTETGNFTKTAERFGYTQSAVSQMMKSLEEELKITLFTRTKHGIHLTSDGKAMLPYIRRLCDDYARVLGQSSAINHLDGAEIRIGTFASISANFLPYAIKRFKEIYPSVKFKLLQADYETVKTWIKDGVVDFGFLTVDVAEELERDFLIKDEMVMILPPNHPKGKKDKLQLRDFSDEPFIFLDQGKKSEPMEYFVKAGVKANLQYRVYDDYTIMNMVEQGLGVSILPKLVLHKHHQKIEVRALTPPIFREVCLAYKSRDAVSVAAKTFIDFAVSIAGSEKFLEDN